VNVVVISQADRLKELEAFLSNVLEASDSSYILICHHKKLVDGIRVGKNSSVIGYFPQYHYQLLLAQLHFSYRRRRFMRRFMRLLRNGSSLGVFVEKVIKYILSFRKRNRLKVIPIDHEVQTYNTNTEGEVWRSKHHEQLEAAMNKIHGQSQIEMVYVFDLVDAPTVIPFCQNRAIEVVLQ